MIQVGLVTLGGYIYSVIPIDYEYESIKNDTNNTNHSSSKSIKTAEHVSFSDGVFFIITTVTTIGLLL
jgi:hypothetical protein